MDSLPLETKYTPFRELVRQRIMFALSKDKGVFTKSGQTVLVLDQFAKRVLSASLTLFEIFDLGFVLIEDVKKVRQRCPTFDVIYLLNPTRKNVKRILEDYQEVDAEAALPPSVTEKDCMEKLFPCIFPSLELPETPTCYRDVVLSITAGHAREVEDDVKKQARRDKERNRFTRALKAVAEFPVQFLALEDSLFSLDLPNALADLYSPSREAEQVEKRVVDVATRLTNVLASANEYPYIRYKKGSINDITERVAQRTQEMIDAHFRDHPSLHPWGLSGEKGDNPLRKDRAVLLIVDRAEDVAAPLLHEFTYQAMVHDVLKLEPGTPYEYDTKTKSGAKAKKHHTVMLDETDPVWSELKHLHITKVIEDVQNAIRAEQDSPAAKAAMDGVGQDMAKMAELVAELTTKDRVRSQKNIQHYLMTTEAMSKFEKYKLNELAMLEQTLATGIDEDNKTMSRSKILAEVKEFLGEDSKLSSERRARLLALYIVSQGGLVDKAREGMDLLDRAGLNKRQQNALLNMPYLGADISLKHRSKSQIAADLAKAKAAAAGAESFLSRFEPHVVTRVKDHLAGELSQEEYPYIFPPPSAMGMDDAPARGAASAAAADPSAGEHRGKSKRSNKGRAWEKRAKAEAGAGRGGGEDESKGGGAGDDRPFEGGRLLTFVIGGMTFSESRAMAMLSKETRREIIFGSTSVLTPRLFLEQLNLLSPMGEDSDVESGAGAAAGAGVDDIDLDV